MANKNLKQAKKNKKDEFYTQYSDIQNEMSAYLEFNPDVFRNKTILLPCDDPEWSNFTKYFALHFEEYGLKKLISTSYAIESKKLDIEWQPTLFEVENPNYDIDKTKIKGKIFTLERDTNNNGRIDIDDLEWRYLDGDGDFRSTEVKALRDEADIIITNPPFSLFREFLKWIIDANKQFVIIGNQNSIACKEIFPLIKDNKMWLGKGFKGGAGHFISKYEDVATASDHKEGMIRVSGVVWFTNIEHGRRHQPMQLMTMADNIKYSKHKEIQNIGYQKYDNYDAIDIPKSDAIPSDYDGVMGVPVTWLYKYCPEQFEILGCTQRGCHDLVPDTKKYDDYWEMKQNGEKTGCSGSKTNENPNIEKNDGKNNYFVNKHGHIVQSAYSRIFIRKKI